MPNKRKNMQNLLSPGVVYFTIKNKIRIANAPHNIVQDLKPWPKAIKPLKYQTR